MMEIRAENVTNKTGISKVKRVTIFALALAVLIPAVGYFRTADKPLSEPAKIAAAPYVAMSSGSSEKFALAMQQAMSGDYQAQRNLAYGYGSQPYDGQEQNPLLACAWYLVVLNSGSPRVDSSDQSNVNLYCGSRLDPALLPTAKNRAVELLATIYPQGIKQ